MTAFRCRFLKIPPTHMEIKLLLLCAFSFGCLLSTGAILVMLWRSLRNPLPPEAMKRGEQRHADTVTALRVRNSLDVQKVRQMARLVEAIGDVSDKLRVERVERVERIADHIIRKNSPAGTSGQPKTKAKTATKKKP
jgi:hypothetical protein